MNKLLPQEIIEQKIFVIRGQKVMLSFALARLYGVEPKALMQAVKRNRERFPEDFMFQISQEELASLRSQIVTLNTYPQSKSKRGRHFKYLPYAFTEQGIAMLSSVLKSKKAVQVNVAIMRTFVKLRQILATHKELAEKLKELEKLVGSHDRQIQSIFQVLKSLTTPPEKPLRKIGF